MKKEVHNHDPFKVKDNTLFEKRHCDLCASYVDHGNNPLDAFGNILPMHLRLGDCKLRGTMHGMKVKVSDYVKLTPMQKLRRFLTFANPYIFSNHNTITNVGHAAMNGRWSNQGSYSAFVNLAIGTGTQGTPATATALATEATTNGAGRGAATATQVTTTVTNDTTQLVKTWSLTGTVAITEEGVFDNASSGGNMSLYQSFSTVTCNNGDTFQATHKAQT